MPREFHDLLQTTKIVVEITFKFRERALLVPQYVVNEQIKKMRYHDMLIDDIIDFVSISGCRTLEHTIDRAREGILRWSFGRSESHLRFRQ